MGKKERKEKNLPSVGITNAKTKIKFNWVKILANMWEIKKNNTYMYTHVCTQGKHTHIKET